MLRALSGTAGNNFTQRKERDLFNNPEIRYLLSLILADEGWFQAKNERNYEHTIGRVGEEKARFNMRA